jgi:uncharacterized protein (TIGR00369 family)
MAAVHRVVTKQPNSRMCLVCGLENSFGLQAQFYELDSRQLFATFRSGDHHQGYPQRLHGGIVASLLDEAIGRAIRMYYPEEVWGVTIELKTRYRQAIPVGEPVRAITRVTHESRRHFEGTGEILLPDGSIASEAHGRFLKLPLSSISDFDCEHQQWRVVAHPEDPQQIEL